MAHIFLSFNLNQKELLKHTLLSLRAVTVVNQNYKRQFKSALFLGLPEKKDASSQHSSVKSKEMMAASPSPADTLPHKSYQTSQNEPTLIGNPVSKGSQNFTTVASPQKIAVQAHIEELHSENDPLKYLLNEVDPTTVNRVYYFDSLAFTKKLEAKGFSRDQAEGCVECFSEIIGSTLEHQAKHMITKSEQRIAENQLHSEISSVKKDMVLLQKSEFTALRTETEKISIDIARVQSHFQDEVVKLRGQFTLDINLERGRAVEAHAANEKSVHILDNKIETEIAHLKTTYEVYRNDIFKYAAGTVLTCTTLIIGFIRLWK